VRGGRARIATLAAATSSRLLLVVMTVRQRSVRSARVGGPLAAYGRASRNAPGAVLRGCGARSYRDPQLTRWMCAASTDLQRADLRHPRSPAAVPQERSLDVPVSAAPPAPRWLAARGVRVGGGAAAERRTSIQRRRRRVVMRGCDDMAPGNGSFARCRRPSRRPVRR
jgi:hypothetical protein